MPLWLSSARSADLLGLLRSPPFQYCIMFWGILGVFAGLPFGGNVLLAVILLPAFLLYDFVRFFYRKGFCQFMIGCILAGVLFSFFTDHNRPLSPMPDSFYMPGLLYRSIVMFVGVPTMEFFQHGCKMTAGILRATATICGALARVFETLGSIN